MANARISVPNRSRQRTALKAPWVRRIRDSNLLPFPWKWNSIKWKNKIENWTQKIEGTKKKWLCKNRWHQRTRFSSHSLMVCINWSSLPQKSREEKKNQSLEQKIERNFRDNLQGFWKSLMKRDWKLWLNEL